MKLFLRLSLLISSICTVACVLASGIGHGFPNTVVAYTESCGDGAGNYLNKIRLTDWKPGIRYTFAQTNGIFLPVSWSPNGQQLTYTINGYEINKYDFDTRLAYVLVSVRNQEARNTAPKWSPKSRLIAFYENDRVAVVDTMTNQTQTFPIYAHNDYANAWSPDSRSLAVAGFSQENQPGLYIVNLESGEIQDLSPEQFFLVNDPAWSPDGNYVTFSASTAPGKSAIYLADLQHDTVSKFFQRDGIGYIASAWSPDSQTIAIVTQESEVLLYDPQGKLRGTVTTFQHLPELNSGNIEIQWSPDGQYLIIHVAVNHQWGNYAYDLATGAVHSLSPGNCFNSTIAWRPALAP
ncbi:MAG: hypothetical protein ABI690_08795 [Chloroflexota bacterium]